MSLLAQKELSRRSFIRLSVFGLITIFLGWRFFFRTKKYLIPNQKNLSSNDAQILAAVYTAITLEDSGPAIAEAISKIDQFISTLTRRSRLELKTALHLLEQSPLLFHGYISRFTGLSLESRTKVLEGWQQGSLWRRPVFNALKELSYLAYYTDSGNWKKIGYNGPL